MTILIDGYNLLHVTGIVGRGIGPGTFARARRGLLGFLAASLDDAERSATTVVFDAADAPPGLPSKLQSQGMTVRYAVGYASADELLEELIQADSAPRSLIVVSSDRQVRRAAKRRRATAVASDQWYAEIWRRRRAAAHESGSAESLKPHTPLSEHEVKLWLREFGKAASSVEGASPSGSHSHEATPADSTTGEKDDLPLGNPFPPGYAEDLLDQD